MENRELLKKWEAELKEIDEAFRDPFTWNIRVAKVLEKIKPQYLPQDFNENFYLDDFPVCGKNQPLMMHLFNKLPVQIQNLAIEFGFSDTVFKDSAFEYLLETQLNMTPKEYYASKIAADYFNKGKHIKIEV